MPPAIHGTPSVHTVPYASMRLRPQRGMRGERMGVFEYFSKRQKKLRGEVSDVSVPGTAPAAHHLLLVHKCTILKA
jgi:hypothetical protein